MLKLVFELLEGIDQKLLLLINGCNSPFWDSIMWFISGKLSWIPLYIMILFFLIKKEGKKWWLVVLSLALLITLADQASVKLFKEVFERYRPTHNFDIKDLVHIVNNKRGGMYGFVSSHAANSFVLAGFVSLIFKRCWVTCAIMLWACLIAYSRVYLALHYPADVFCGGVLGLCISFFVYKLYMYLSIKIFKY